GRRPLQGGGEGADGQGGEDVPVRGRHGAAVPGGAAAGGQGRAGGARVPGEAVTIVVRCQPAPRADTARRPSLRSAPRKVLILFSFDTYTEPPVVSRWQFVRIRSSCRERGP